MRNIKANDNQWVELGRIPKESLLITWNHNLAYINWKKKHEYTEASVWSAQTRNCGELLAPTYSPNLEFEHVKLQYIVG